MKNKPIKIKEIMKRNPIYFKDDFETAEWKFFKKWLKRTNCCGEDTLCNECTERELEYYQER